MSQADDVNYTDADLVTLLRAGNEEAISRLVEQWSPTMLQAGAVVRGQPAIRRGCGPGGVAGDAGRPGQVRRPLSLRTWTFTILVNRARTRGVREARTLPRSPLGDGADEQDRSWLASFPPRSGPGASPRKAGAVQETLLQLDRAVSTLPPRQRRCNHADISGMSPRRSARRWGSRREPAGPAASRPSHLRTAWPKITVDDRIRREG